MTFREIRDKSQYIIVRGSYIYGTMRPDSDIDMYAICTDDVDLSEFGESDDNDVVECIVKYETNVFDIQVVHESWFLNQIKEQDVAILELLWQGQTPFDYNYENFHKRYDGEFVLNPWQLRQWTSAHCNNSWAKAQKKMTLYPPTSSENYIGRKSLWHVFRLYDFSEQILTYGRIVEYEKEGLIQLYHEIVENDKEWKELKQQYQPLRNKMASRIRVLAERPI